MSGAKLWVMTHALRILTLALFLTVLSAPMGVVAGQLHTGALRTGAPLPPAGRTIISFSKAIPFLHTTAARNRRSSIRSALLSELSSKIRFAPTLSGFVVADLSSSQITALASDPRITSLSPDYKVQATVDENSTASWGLDRIDEPSLPLDGRFHTLNDGEGVDIYIIDSGVKGTHKAFGSRVLAGASFVGGVGNDDCDGHGTHVAGTAAGDPYGVARAATIIPVRVLDCNGSGDFSTVLAGIDWAVQNMLNVRNRPSVANLSLGCVEVCYVPDVTSALNAAVSSGLTIAVAAGNEIASDACDYGPPAASAVITVGATTDTDTRAYFSNIGTCVDIFAPGMNITSADYASRSGSTSMNGTSMASPHVAGAAALIRSAYPLKTPAEVRTALMAAATPGVVTYAGTGSANLLLRVDTLGVPFAAPTSDTPPSVSGTPGVGSTLTAVPGTWIANPAPTYQYAWYRCTQLGVTATPVPEGCSPISRATKVTYKIVNADAGSWIRVKILAANSVGSTPNFSPSTTVIVQPPVNSSAPTISGSSAIGATLTGSPGTWTGSPTPEYAYSWWWCTSSGRASTSPSGCTQIAEETNTTYVVDASDVSVGSYIRFKVTASNGTSVSAYSAATSAVGYLPTNSGAPTISGTAKSGQTLSLLVGTWAGTPKISYSYSWFRCDVEGVAGATLPGGGGCVAISRATKATYKATSSDIGKFIAVLVTAKNSAGSAVWASASTSAVAP